MKRPLIQVIPSILSADFGKLALEAKKAEECGADAYVIKPFKMDTLINKVSKLLKIDTIH